MKIIAEVTHPPTEGIKGAQAIATALHFACFLYDYYELVKCRDWCVFKRLAYQSIQQEGGMDGGVCSISCSFSAILQDFTRQGNAVDVGITCLLLWTTWKEWNKKD